MGPKEGCRHATAWPDEIAFHCSTVQFETAGIRNLVFQALAIPGIARDRLEVEISESVFLKISARCLRRSAA